MSFAHVQCYTWNDTADFWQTLVLQEMSVEPNFLVCCDWVCGQINCHKNYQRSSFERVCNITRGKEAKEFLIKHSDGTQESSTWWIFFYGHHRILQQSPQKWKLASCMTELCLCTQLYTTWSSTKHTKCLVSERSLKGSKLLSWPNATLLYSRPNPRVSYSWITGWCIWPEWKTVV